MSDKPETEIEYTDITRRELSSTLVNALTRLIDPGAVRGVHLIFDMTMRDDFTYDVTAKLDPPTDDVEYVAALYDRDLSYESLTGLAAVLVQGHGLPEQKSISVRSTRPASDREYACLVSCFNAESTKAATTKTLKEKTAQRGALDTEFATSKWKLNDAGIADYLQRLADLDAEITTLKESL